jgi:hypothetical protein
MLRIRRTGNTAFITPCVERRRLSSWAGWVKPWNMSAWGFSLSEVVLSSPDSKYSTKFKIKQIIILTVIIFRFFVWVNIIVYLPTSHISSIGCFYFSKSKSSQIRYCYSTISMATAGHTDLRGRAVSGRVVPQHPHPRRRPPAVSRNRAACWAWPQEDSSPRCSNMKFRCIKIFNSSKCRKNW